MLSDFLVKLAGLATNGVITEEEYRDIYNIITKAKQRQENSVYIELAEKLNEQYKNKLVCEHVGGYHCFGYPTFKADTDRIIMYFKPYYTYFKGSGKIESRFKDHDYTSLRKDEIDTRIKPITLEELEEILKTFEGVDVEYVLNKFRDDPRRKNVAD